MRVGLLMYGAGLVMAVALVESGLHVAWRAVAFVPFLAGSLMVFQAVYATCPMRAARGERETDIGVERVASAEQRSHDKRRATTVLATSILVAFLTTASLYLLP